MRFLPLIMMLLSLSYVTAQDTTKIERLTPKLVTSLANGETFIKDDIAIKFLEVVTDSRCPKNVNCIRAGEAEVLIVVFKGDKKIEQKSITIHAVANLQKQINVIFDSEVFSISGFNLLPYPSYGTMIEAKDYVLQLKVSE